VERKGPAERQLTGAGPRSQRGLESPGAEVGRCSLKDEGDRQGDKHGPLSTWWPLLFFFYLSLTFLLLLSAVQLSFFGLSSFAFQVCGQPLVRMLGRCRGKKKRDQVFVYFFRESSHICLMLDFLQLWYTDGYCGPRSRMVRQIKHTAICGARSGDRLALGYK